MLDYWENIEAQILDQKPGTQGFNIPEELDIGRPPDFLSGVLSKFFDIHRGRRYTDSGPCPLSFGDIIAWQQLFEWETSLFEWDIIRNLDSLYLRVTAEAARNK